MEIEMILEKCIENQKEFLNKLEIELSQATSEECKTVLKKLSLFYDDEILHEMQLIQDTIEERKITVIDMEDILEYFQILMDHIRIFISAIAYEDDISKNEIISTMQLQSYMLIHLHNMFCDLGKLLTGKTFAYLEEGITKVEQRLTDKMMNAFEE